MRAYSKCSTPPARSIRHAVAVQGIYLFSFGIMKHTKLYKFQISQDPKREFHGNKSNECATGEQPPFADDVRYNGQTRNWGAARSTNNNGEREWRVDPSTKYILLMPNYAERRFIISSFPRPESTNNREKKNPPLFCRVISTHFRRHCKTSRLASATTNRP